MKYRDVIQESTGSVINEYYDWLLRNPLSQPKMRDIFEYLQFSRDDGDLRNEVQSRYKKISRDIEEDKVIHAQETTVANSPYAQFVHGHKAISWIFPSFDKCRFLNFKYLNGTNIKPPSKKEMQRAYDDARDIAYRSPRSETMTLEVDLGGRLELEVIIPKEGDFDGDIEVGYKTLESGTFLDFEHTSKWTASGHKKMLLAAEIAALGIDVQ